MPRRKPLQEITARTPSPVLARPVQPRLIDAGMLPYNASASGQAERYRRGATSHTIHVWWARRPHSAMRALVFASLVRDTRSARLELLGRLGSDANVSSEVLQAARQVMADEYASPPRLLDMFAGGGTIPLEAARLGIEAYALDSNQLATFINRCNLGWAASPQRGDLVRQGRDAP